MTAPKRPAIERAADAIRSVRDAWYPVIPTPADELRAIDIDVLRELADERQMSNGCTYPHHWDAVYSAVACPGCQGGRRGRH